MYKELFEEIADQAPDLLSGVEDFFAGAAEVLRQTDYADACPIATVALEVASTDEPLRGACAEVFESWIASMSARAMDAGIDRDTARRLAITLIAELEGGFLLCRAARTTEALEVAGVNAAAAVRAALDGSTRRE